MLRKKDDNNDNDIGVSAAFKQNISQQCYSFPQKPKQSEIYTLKEKCLKQENVTVLFYDESYNNTRNQRIQSWVPYLRKPLTSQNIPGEGAKNVKEFPNQRRKRTEGIKILARRKTFGSPG